MIELLLQAEQAMAVGMVDQADRLYWQIVDSDPGNAIAIVGLARVAIERQDERTALAFARKALEVDPDNGVAGRLVARLEEVIRERGDVVPAGVASLPATSAPAPPVADTAGSPLRAPTPGPAPAPEPLSAHAPDSLPAHATTPGPTSGATPDGRATPGSEPSPPSRPDPARSSPRADPVPPAGSRVNPPARRGLLGRLLGRG